MKQVSLTAELRTEYGKNVARKIRRAGAIPAVLYGQNTDAMALSLNLHQLKKAMGGEGMESTLIDLIIGEGEGAQKKIVMLKELQVDPVKRSYLHADFYEIDMSEKITVPISIHLVGKAKGVEAGGILRQIKREVEVTCLPSVIPEYIEMDIRELEIGKSIFVKQIELKEGVEITEDQNIVIATVLPPTVVKEEIPVEEGEEEEKTEETAEPPETEQEEGTE